MANLKEIRQRIASVQTTRQVTSAMKLVSAAKLRKAQDAVIKLRPFANKLAEILANLSETLNESGECAFTKGHGDGTRLLVVAINSNRGLCGAFNSNVNKAINQVIAEQKPQGFTNADVIAIGKNAFEFAKRSKLEVTEFNELYSTLDFAHALPIIDQIMGDFAAGKYDKVVLIYNFFKNASTQVVTTEQLLPIVPAAQTGGKNAATNYIFEPSEESLVEKILPMSLRMQFYKAVLNSYAAEHAARMTAMHKATDNATELLRTLNLQYNKARQAAITNEITEIVGGADALKE